MNLLVACVGVVIIVGLAVLIGTSVDTAAQRAEWKRVADQRRLRNEQLQQLQELRRQVIDERLQWAEERRSTVKRAPDGLCEDCPFGRRPRPRST